ncbi:Major facilitator superfamily domain, general substrate transporter [Pseudocohnilembus persalinus]|uniref:Major facilitator superfamily domain, general substrate transporter n=1 Tax=Pseudocohnilembus persalinus TaxID=266149 RepID=A0A0V0QLS3_PSEPJ|nr:Major facilitator superfamily domain, general substrate transporter [Pseudocohnilembus persalinus]|eukprot:KRX03032.1 Major facilitator superfamily domain, general substrate transporter [Pseudocohnilembus persalinus]
MPYSDSKGRKRGICISWACFTVGVFLVSFFTNLKIVYLGLFLAGLGASPPFNLGQIYLFEVSAGKFQALSICLLYVFWSLSEIIIYPLTLITTQWQQFIFYFIFLPVLLLNLGYFMIIESPLFSSQFSIQQSYRQLNKIGKQNKKLMLIENEQIINQFEKQESVQNNNQKEDSPKFCDLFETKQLRSYTFLLLLISIGSNIGIYGIQFALSQIGSDFAKNSLYVGIADMIGYLLANYMGSSYKRKKVSLISFLSASVLCMLFVFIKEKDEGFLCFSEKRNLQEIGQKGDNYQQGQVFEDNVQFLQNQENIVCYYKEIQLFVVMMSRLLISIFTSFLAIWRTELYPIKVRSNGIGFVGALGLIGAQIFPLFELLSEKFGIQIIVLIGVFCFISGIPGFFLKETLIQKQKQKQNKNIHNVPPFEQHKLITSDQDNQHEVNFNENSTQDQHSYHSEYQSKQPEEIQLAIYQQNIDTKQKQQKPENKQDKNCVQKLQKINSLTNNQQNADSPQKLNRSKTVGLNQKNQNDKILNYYENHIDHENEHFLRESIISKSTRESQIVNEG